jgi:hypothetical protein
MPSVSVSVSLSVSLCLSVYVCMCLCVCSVSLPPKLGAKIDEKVNAEVSNRVKEAVARSHKVIIPQTNHSLLGRSDLVSPHARGSSSSAAIAASTSLTIAPTHSYLDWSLKSRIKVTSSLPLDWCVAIDSHVEAFAIHNAIRRQSNVLAHRSAKRRRLDSTANILDEDRIVEHTHLGWDSALQVPCPRCLSMQRQLSEALVYWSYPVCVCARVCDAVRFCFLYDLRCSHFEFFL